MAGRRSNGEGSVYQRKDTGRWFGSVTLGYKDGKRVPGDVDPYSMIIPDAVADKLQITAADTGKAPFMAIRSITSPTAWSPGP